MSGRVARSPQLEAVTAGQAGAGGRHRGQSECVRAEMGGASTANLAGGAGSYWESPAMSHQAASASHAEQRHKTVGCTAHCLNSPPEPP
jgi:hypothetical protein